MSTKKPFKLGATYKLVEPDQFRYTNAILSHYGKYSFSFTVHSIDSDGAVRDANRVLIAVPRERDFFKRIDNKG